MTVAIYARVSTPGQDADNQAVQLREYAWKCGWTIHREYTDVASGKRSDRAELDRLLQDAATRQFDVVLTWALDRFTREGVAETFAYIKRLRANGVQFHSMTEEHFRTTGPAGELMIAIAAWIATQERVRISERTKAGLENARRRGKVLGRPRVIVDRLKLRGLVQDGLSLRAIAAQERLSLGTVQRAVADLPHPAAQ